MILRGLGGSNWKRKRGRLRQEFHSYLLDGQVDVLLIQEHRLSRTIILEYGSIIQGDYQVFWAEGYGQEENAEGVSMFIRGIWNKALQGRV